MNTIPTNQEMAELAAWRRGPWVLKSDHDRMVAALREQLTKALEAVADAHKANQQIKKTA